MNAGTAISAQGAAIAVFRAISSARRRPQAAMPIAAPIPISASTRNCSPIAAANPQGGSDAHSGLGDFGDRDGLNRAGGGPDVPYPVCLHVYGRANYYECRYTSLPQCNVLASGRAAQCVINSYFASAEEPAGYRRHRRVY